MESKGLEALEHLNKNIIVAEDIDEDFNIIEKELKAKANLVSMCENLAKLVGLKEKDYVELETLITKKLKALEIITRELNVEIEEDKGTYFLCITGWYIEIPKKEYALLKEVLK